MEREQTIFQQTSSSARKGPQAKRRRRGDAERQLGFRLTARDLAILTALAGYRLMSTRQVQALFFPPVVGTKINTRCQRRLTGLARLGLVERREQPTPLSEGRKPLLYLLSRQGYDFLVQHTGNEVDWHPHDNAISAAYIDHTLKTNDFRIAVTRAVQRHNACTLERWLDEKTLKRQADTVTISNAQGESQRAAIIPDGYFHLAVAKEGEVWDYHHFIEIDLSTVTGQSSRWGRRDWARKIRAYLALAHSGTFEARYGAQGFRVLTVTTGGERRLSHLKAVTEAVGKRIFWFTTFARVTAETVLTAPIWQMASADGLHALLR